MIKEKIIIITGPSGVGKATIAFALLKKNSSFAKVITYTTRKPRTGEKEGINYHFISEQEFKEKINRDDFFEWAINYENYYGNNKKNIEEVWTKGQTPVIVVDIKGALTFKEKIPQAIVFFVRPDSIKNLIGRLNRRGSITEADFGNRMKMVEAEMELAKKCDYVVINKENCLEETVDDIEKILKSV
jgi:guanylate kinase